MYTEQINDKLKDYLLQIKKNQISSPAEYTMKALEANEKLNHDYSMPG